MTPALLRFTQFCVMRLLLSGPEKGTEQEVVTPPCFIPPQTPRPAARCTPGVAPHRYMKAGAGSATQHVQTLLQRRRPQSHSAPAALGVVSASSSARVVSGLTRFAGDRRWPRAGPRTEHPRLSDLNSAQARKVQAAAAHSASPRCLSSVSATVRVRLQGSRSNHTPAPALSFQSVSAIRKVGRKRLSSPLPAAKAQPEERALHHRSRKLARSEGSRSPLSSGQGAGTSNPNSSQESHSQRVRVALSFQSVSATRTPAAALGVCRTQTPA